MHLSFSIARFAGKGQSEREALSNTPGPLPSDGSGPSSPPRGDPQKRPSTRSHLRHLFETCIVTFRGSDHGAQWLNGYCVLLAPPFPAQYPTPPTPAWRVLKKTLYGSAVYLPRRVAQLPLPILHWTLAPPNALLESMGMRGSFIGAGDGSPITAEKLPNPPVCLSRCQQGTTQEKREPVTSPCLLCARTASE